MPATLPCSYAVMMTIAVPSTIPATMVTAPSPKVTLTSGALVWEIMPVPTTTRLRLTVDTTLRNGGNTPLAAHSRALERSDAVDRHGQHAVDVGNRDLRCSHPFSLCASAPTASMRPGGCAYTVDAAEFPPASVLRSQLTAPTDGLPPGVYALRLELGPASGLRPICDATFEFRVVESTGPATTSVTGPNTSVPPIATRPVVPTERLPVPHGEAKNRALALVEERVQGRVRRARTPEQKAVLASKLFDQARQTVDDPARGTCCSTRPGRWRSTA